MEAESSRAPKGKNIDYYLGEFKHSRAEIRTRFGSEVETNFVALFKDRLMGGIALPMSEVIDALENVDRACARVVIGMLRSIPPQEPAFDKRVKALLASILETAQGIDTLDTHNDQISFICGVGRVANELECHDVTYFDERKPQEIVDFLEKLVKAAKAVPKDMQDYTPKLMTAIAELVAFSSSIPSMMKHLEIIESDREAS